MKDVKESAADRWRDVAHTLVSQSAQSVHCPDCGRHSLSVRDMEYGYGAEKGVQRYLMCSGCGAFQVVSIKRAGAAA
ncbi:MAG: hypothetical protein NW215_02980 [Hyphomicrobiales bacterium]|nr:hypothetical protein [Hyphomicrobiales bacterium]